MVAAYPHVSVGGATVIYVTQGIAVYGSVNNISIP